MQVPGFLPPVHRTRTGFPTSALAQPSIRQSESEPADRYSLKFYTHTHTLTFILYKYVNIYIFTHVPKLSSRCVFQGTYSFKLLAVGAQNNECTLAKVSVFSGAVTLDCRARWCFARGQVYRTKRLHIHLLSGDAPGCRSESLTLKPSFLLEKSNHPSTLVSFT